MFLPDLWEHALRNSRRQGSRSDARKPRWRSRRSDRNAHLCWFKSSLGSHWRTCASISGVSFVSYVIRGQDVNQNAIRIGQIEINYILDGSATSSLGMFELTVPPGSNVPPPHSHSHNEECVYVLEGTLRYSVGTETRDLSAGDSMRTPRGVVHAFLNPFSKAAKALIVQSPDIGAQYFRDVAAVANAGGAPDRSALIAVMSRYGLVPAAPPDDARRIG